MKLMSHGVSFSVTAGVYYCLISNWPSTIVCFLSGILIDLDHMADFYRHHRQFCRSLKELEDFCDKKRGGKIYLLFHSYELLGLGWIILYNYPRLWLLALLIGVSVHLILDQVFNGVYPWAYFVIYRAYHKFPREVFSYGDFVQILKQRRNP